VLAIAALDYTGMIHYCIMGEQISDSHFPVESAPTFPLIVGARAHTWSTVDGDWNDGDIDDCNGDDCDGNVVDGDVGDDDDVGDSNHSTRST
jgi:hypothetical protein